MIITYKEFTYVKNTYMPLREYLHGKYPQSREIPTIGWYPHEQYPLIDTREIEWLTWHHTDSMLKKILHVNILGTRIIAIRTQSENTE
jgi:hypothetical protein